MRICVKCEKQKELNEFYKSKSNIDGLQTNCKTCARNYQRQRTKFHKERATVIVPLEKKCYNCREIKSSEEFYKSKSNIDGLQGNCKTCVKDYQKERAKIYKARGSVIIPFEKKCYRCKEIKPSEEFYKSKSAINGLQGNCRKCGTELNREKQAKRKKWYKAYKESLFCEMCHASGKEVVLCFHHKIKRKQNERSISELIYDYIKISDLIILMKACMILCSSCHTKRHIELGWGREACMP